VPREALARVGAARLLNDLQMKLVVFGNSTFASLAWYCLTNDSPYDVVAFTVDAPYLTSTELQGLPVVDFATVERDFPPLEHAMLLPVGPVAMNALRAERCERARGKGYRLARYVSSRALTWPDLQLGENGIIYEGAIVQPFAKLGYDVIVRSGAHVSHHASVGEHCFIAPGACLGGNVRLEPRCFVGLNATVRDGITVAAGCCVGAGAVVVADTEPDGLYVGVPARRAARPASQLAAI
jgi:sugar O-acyltransferase (sialic acid O-acetyltransferase NeuD family)